MQSVMKKYFFVVNLLFIAVAAYLLARAGNIFAGHFLANTLPQVRQDQSQDQAAKKSQPRRLFSTATDRNIFDAKREDLVEQPVDKQPQKTSSVDPDAEAVPTSLNIKLIATTVFIPAEWSLAQIEDLSAKNTGIYSVNSCDPNQRAAPTAESDADDDEGGEAESAEVVVRSVERPAPCNRLLDTATITAIETTRVVFINEQTQQKEFIAFGAEPKAGRPVIASAKPRARHRGRGGPTGKGIHKVGANSYEIDQEEIDATLSNLNSIATQARIVPSFKDGQANGFKLFSIRPGSLYSKIGIKNGDVVQRINGYEISSPDKALEIYSKLKNSKQITVDINRRGKNQTLDYSIVR